MSLTPASLVLVAVVKNPHDLEITRLLGWYRIPLRSAPRVIAVDYLAFYLTGAFDSEKWSIRYIAPVLGHELTTRLELLRDEPDHPHAQQEYYKIQLGPLERLNTPILAERWRRITFFYTTGEYLLQARTVIDLIIHSDERQTLWRTLRERASQPELESEAEDIALDPELLAVLLGLKGMGANASNDSSGKIF
jgi:hypothetical protein